ncbi:helix-turn-helix transcriptional regulator [Thalassobellus citreus]|uniref:helix-turn-helix transcriptional regulator n=1 Tax=Thalassobellus citreus TaxID=3367752 RepID=UPI0037934F3A
MITNTANLQKQNNKFIAGMMPNDHNIEFVGIPATEEVIWFQRGHTHQFKHLPRLEYNLLLEAYLENPGAAAYCRKKSDDQRRQVEIFTYHMYGEADFTPDIIDGVLQPSENYRHSKEWNYENWSNKHITINGHHLNTRQIAICDMMLEDKLDKQMADALNIAVSTLPHHKRKLYELAGVQSKAQFVMVLKDERI